MVKVTKPGLDILQSRSGHASHWVKDVEFESVIVVWASVFTLKFTHAKLLVVCIYATTIFGNEGRAYPLFYLLVWVGLGFGNDEVLV